MSSPRSWPRLAQLVGNLYVPPLGRAVAAGKERVGWRIKRRNPQLYRPNERAQTIIHEVTMER